MFSRNMSERFGEADCVADLNARTYLGTPLKSSDGHTLGILCVMSDQPRVFDEEEIRILELFAHYAGKQFEEHL